MSKKFYLYTNVTKETIATKEKLLSKMHDYNIQQTDSIASDTDLIVCIGGDGTLLNLIHEIGVPDIPVVGINTGHLGFFQDITPDQLDDFLKHYVANECSIQELATVEASIWTKDSVEHVHGINEIVVKGEVACNVHLDISVGQNFIERFSGDGILVATPAGSTAYNYSLGGGIVDPRLELLQVTPIAPMNTTAYRSFTSPLILPSDLSLEALPIPNPCNTIHIESDGFVFNYDAVTRIQIRYSEKKLQNLKLFNYDFWTKVKDKFL